MSEILFPLITGSGDRLEVAHRFPTDAQLTTLDARDWISFMAQYRSSRPMTIRAPMAGTIRFVRKTAGGAPVTLLEFRPLNYAALHNIPGWAAPVARSFIFSFGELDSETVRRGIYEEALRQYRTRHGNRLIRGTITGGRLRSADNWLIEDSNISDRARIALETGSGIVVDQDQPIAVSSHIVSVGMVYYSGNDLASATPYWFDVHEYFKIYKLYHDSQDLGFPFQEERRRGFFRIRYEDNANPTVNGGNRIETVSGGLQEVKIFHPPTETIRAGGGINTRTRAIPNEIFSFTPNVRVDLHFSRTSVNYRLQLFRDTASTRSLHNSRQFSGQDPQTLFGAVGYAWPEGRITPYNLAFTAANGVGLSIFMVRDLIRVVDELAGRVLEYKTDFARWIQQPGFAEKARLVDNINQIIRYAPAEVQDNLRDGLDNSRFVPFSAVYHQRQLDRQQAVDDLVGAMNADFFQQFKADLSDEAMETLDKAIEALRNENRGDQFLQETFRGFLLDTPEVIDASPPLQYDLLKAVWNSQRRFRGRWVKLLFESVREDMFYHLRSAARRIGTPLEDSIEPLIQSLQRQYTRRFGELFAFSVAEVPETVTSTNPFTGEVRSITRTYSTGSRLIFSYDTNALSEIDPAREAGVTGGTYARDYMGRMLNVFNLVGTLVRLGQDLLHANKHRDMEAYYNVTKDLASLVGDISHLLPTRHYAGFMARPGWSQFGRGLGLVFSAVSLGSMIEQVNDLHAEGNYLSSSLMMGAAASSAVTIGAEALVLLGAGSATTGPLAVIIIGGALISIWFDILARAVADPTVVVDFKHCFFGDQYQRIERQYRRLPATVQNDFVALFNRNHRFSWVNDLPRQVAHLNGYLSPLNATLTNRRTRDPETRRQGKEIKILIHNARCVQQSRVWFEVFTDSTPHFGTIGTFPISEEAARSRDWMRGEPAFFYRVTVRSNGRADVEIRMNADLSSPFARINRAVVAVDYDKSIEYTLEPEESSEWFRPIRMMRDNPFDVGLHQFWFNKNSMKSMMFLQAA